MRWIAAWLVACSLWALPAHAGQGKVFLTVAEALELAFPKCQVERETHYLDKQEAARAAKLAKVDDMVRIARPYVARKDGVVVGYAYFDTHRVRTLKETLMIVVDPAQRLARVEVLAFGEPQEYIPVGAFWTQFAGHRLDDDLDLKRGVRGVTGATLTARAATLAARRVLALHRIVFGEPAPEPSTSRPNARAR